MLKICAVDLSNPAEDHLEPPMRDLTSPLRLPISNVFKGQSSGIAISGRVCGGVVQVGERVRVLPGDETAVIKSMSELSWHRSVFLGADAEAK